MEILKTHYNSEPVNVLCNLHRLFNYGALAGTGKLVVLPVDQGFEHGPWQAFGKNQDCYDPRYFFKLAKASMVNGITIPCGYVQQREMHDFDIPTIMKLNHSNKFSKHKDQSLVASVHEAFRLGCVGVGFTVYPGSEYQFEMFEELRDVVDEARSLGMFTVSWAYPRANDMPQEANDAVDVVCYAVHMLAAAGVHIIKTKPPQFDQNYLSSAYKPESLQEAVKLVIQSACNRVVLFSGGAFIDSLDAFMNDVRSIAAAGAHGSIVGRNAFQRPYNDAVACIKQVCEIYKSNK